MEQILRLALCVCVCVFITNTVFPKAYVFFLNSFCQLMCDRILKGLTTNIQPLLKRDFCSQTVTVQMIPVHFKQRLFLFA